MLNIPILMYHSVNDAPLENPLGRLSISLDEFDAQLKAIVSLGFEFVTISQLLDAARQGYANDRKWAVLTFDDGYLDNLLNAAPILESYGARATVFVSPAFICDGRVRSIADVPNGWGYLNWAELQALYRSGTFDVQSHTLTHDHVFVSDRVVDVYTADKFDRYYWLTHLLEPDTKKAWEGDVSPFATVVPDGYPIFEYDRALAGRRFFPSDQFVRACVAAYEGGGEAEVRRLAAAQIEKGRLESAEELGRRLEAELTRSKRIIEGRLRSEVSTVCFPGGTYNDVVLQHAERAGYVAFFRSSRDAPRDNRSALTALALPPNDARPIGLSRISFSRDYPRTYLRRQAAFWNARLKLRAYMQPGRRQVLFPMLRSIRNVFYQGSG